MKYLKYLGVAAALLLFSSSLCLAAEENSLSALTNSGKPIKVYVKDFANESGQSQIDAAAFKNAFETALKNRKAVTFEIVPSADASDVEISGIIKKYLYSETDPINSYASTATLVVDALTTENYAELTVDFTVTDAKSGNVLWNKNLMSYVERKMTPGESIPLVYDKLSRDFLWKSFGKPNR
jgi:hypothetical protein